MNSTPEEDLLLLNKWMSASERVLILLSDLSSPTKFAVRLEGFISDIEPETGTVLVESGENFILLRLSGATDY